MTEDEPIRVFAEGPRYEDGIREDAPSDVLDALIQREDEGDFRLVERPALSPYQHALAISVQ